MQGMLHTDFSSSSVESAQLCKSETDCDNSRETFLPKTDTEILSDPAETKPTPDNCRAPSKCESANAVAKKNARKSVRWQDIVQKEEAEDDEEEEEETSSDDSEEYVELCRPTTINFVHTPSTNVVQVGSDVILHDFNNSNNKNNNNNNNKIFV